MRFDELGYPAPQGASDFADSSHLAGVLAITKHPMQVDCRKYVITKVDDCYKRKSCSLDFFYYPNKMHYVRHIDEKRFDFSRDQFTPLAVGLIAQGHNEYVNLDFITGKDILPPSVRGLARIAQGKKPTLIQRLWLKGEIYWHSYLQPLDEPFQILAMIMTYDNFAGNNELLKLWTSKNKLWRWSIYRYLSQLDGAWRGEQELAEHIIKYIEQKINV